MCRAVEEPFQTDWGDADYAFYGYAWDCTKSGSVGDSDV